MVTSSTYLAGSFKIQNLSTRGEEISRVVIAITTAILPDLVFDTTGTAGANGWAQAIKPPMPEIAVVGKTSPI